MAWQFTPAIFPYILVMFLAVAIAIGVAIYTVAMRAEVSHDPGVKAFVALNLGSALWSGGYALQLLSVDVPQKRTWLAVAWVGAYLVALSWFAFAVSHAGYDHWLRRRTILLLSVEPAIAFVLFATRFGDLYARQVDTVVVEGLVRLDRSLGPMGVLHVLYAYVLLFAGAGFLVRTVARSESIFRGQAVALLVAMFVPLTANVVWLLELGPVGNLDFTAVGFAVSGVAFAFAIYRHRLFDLSPVARNTVIENMRDVVLVVDESGRVVDANPAAELLGVGMADRLVGKPVTDAFPFLESVLEQGGAKAGEGNAKADEVTVETADGTRHFDVTVQVITPGSDGNRLLLLRDVTEQRVIEQRYQRLIENSSDMITVLDEDGVVKYDSPAVEHLLGYDQDEWVGRPSQKRVHPDDRPRIIEEFQRGIKEPGYTTSVEYRIKHADGSWRVFETFGSNLLSDPVVQGVVLNSRDITERKQRERELERTNERLDQFASVVSHDLRNPLHVADGYLTMAKRGEDEALDVIEESHAQMESIIDDALELARQGQAVEETETVSVTAAAETAWANLDTESATLAVENEVTVEANETRLLRLFENLFRNALEHAGSDVTVTVGSLPPRASDGGANDTTAHVGFYVEDDGPGIPEGDREHVFESGYTTAESGTGFGLAIVDTIAEAHGWSASVGAGERGGARFEFAPGAREPAPDS